MSITSVLIVEDEVLIALSIKMELSRAGYRVCGMASRGEEAISLALQHQPDVILMDIGLPGGLDGFATARGIRTASSAPIIFVSGYIDQAERVDAPEYAPATFLSKPVTFPRLEGVLRAVIAPPGD